MAESAERGGASKSLVAHYTKAMNGTIDSSHNYLYTVVSELKESLDSGRYRNAERGVKMINCLLNANVLVSVFLITPQKRMERESLSS